MIICDNCAGEGRIYRSRYGGNDPDQSAHTCPVCLGRGEVEPEECDEDYDDECLS